MKHWYLSLFAAVCCIHFGTTGKRCGAQSTGDFPNIVLIMTDNQGAWTLGCYGNSDIRTPNIDRLAAEGTLFTNSFSSNPVCSPTRATFLTGLMPSQHGVHSFLSGGRLQVGPNARCTLDQFTSMPEVLKEAGYTCGLVGKWHLGDNLNPQEGFDKYWITMPHGGTSTFYDAAVIENGKIRKEPKYLTELWTEHAVKFIEQQTGDDKPFFLFLAYNGPYSLGRLLLKEGQNRHAEYYADQPLLSFPRQAPHPWQLNNRDYINNPVSVRRVATEVSGVDDGVGTVMQTLKDQGIDENTIVIFVADQGWVGGHGGFFGMGDHTRPLTARDGMMRIPTIWRHPNKIVVGKRTDHMIANYDLMPTLLSYLGLPEKMPAEPRSPGHDYSTVLLNRQPEIDSAKPVFYEFENLRCIRTQRFKYVHRHPNGPHELYDLQADGDEFINLVDFAKWNSIRGKLKRQLDVFFGEYALPKYDLWKGGTSQVRIHDGIDEEVAQLTSVDPPALPDGFKPAEIQVPEGFSVELAAGPPLVTHPTMGCFDDRGRLYICNNAGVNLSSEELEKQLPNAIRRLSDTDGDGRFDQSTVFADKMTFPMGGAWHDGSLYVASPPNIWKLTDTDDDGIADKRQVIVEQFGYTGNAASIHGCFFGADGRLYWCDGYHGHEFTDEDGKVTSKREGSYIFSCLPDGSDVQILCGGGMDNPVEVDLTDEGDVLGTVNILYTRPRVDCLVHWQYGGAYPHRERVLKELSVTGALLGPAYRFGHVAVSGMTRYRSGAMNHQWKDNLFTTFFNHGKVARLEMRREGSTWGATQHEFLSSTSRDFHPTDVIEDADGSLLVVDTGGWFYRGCPTSQFAKPELLGGIYRIRRQGMTAWVDPRGTRIDWAAQSATDLMKLLNDTRFAVRQQAISECARRGKSIIATMKTMVSRGDIRVRRNCLWALARLAQQPSTADEATDAIMATRLDREPRIRQLAIRSLGQSVGKVSKRMVASQLGDTDAGVRREAATTLGKLGGPDEVSSLVRALDRAKDRSEEHAIIYALIQINAPDVLLRDAMTVKRNDGGSPAQNRMPMLLTVLSQLKPSLLESNYVFSALESSDRALRQTALKFIQSRPDWIEAASGLLCDWLSDEDSLLRNADVAQPLIASMAGNDKVAAMIGEILSKSGSEKSRAFILNALAAASSIPSHKTWIAPLKRELESGDHDSIATAMRIVSVIQTDQFNDQLTALGSGAANPPSLRFLAMKAVHKSASKPIFTLAMEMLTDATRPSDAMEATRWLSAAKLNDEQLATVAQHLSSATPTQLRELIKCFTHTRDTKVADTFLDAVGSADAFLTLAESELSDVIKRYPQETLTKANAVLDRLKQHEQQKRSKLSRLLAQLNQGDADRGHKVFNSEKAKCSACHRVADHGKQIGPDLTTIGANRSASDLLESIVLPSASIVRDYGTYNVLTDDGRTFSGLVVSESENHLVLQLSTGEQVTIVHDEIEQLKANPVSIMPNGLDEALTEADLADVVAYLKSLR